MLLTLTQRQAILLTIGDRGSRDNRGDDLGKEGRMSRNSWIVKGVAMCMGCRLTSDKESSISVCLDGIYRCNDCALKAFKPAPPKSDAEIAWDRYACQSVVREKIAAEEREKAAFIAGFNAEAAK